VTPAIPEPADERGGDAGQVGPRAFRAFVASQFLGAFNDNAFKMLVLLLVAGLAAGRDTLPWVEASWAARTWGQAAPAFLFALPFVVLGPLTGALADRVSKTRIVRAANLLEVVVMGLGTLAFLGRSYDGLLVTVLFMGAQSALFGPAKYGIIKELVGGPRLARANAVIQASTMVAILCGNVVGGTFAERLGGQLLPWAGAWYVTFAALGWLASLAIPVLPPAAPDRRISLNPVRELVGHLRAVRGDRVLGLALAGSAFFYAVAALFVSVVVAYGTWLGVPESRIGLLNAAIILGIVVGALVAGRVGRRGEALALAPLGLGVMLLGTLIVHLDPASLLALRTALFLIGVGAGLFSIPVRVLVQGRPRESDRGSIQGLGETLDFVGILLAGPVFWVLEKGLGLGPPGLFLAGSVLLACALAVCLTLGPRALARSSPPQAT
jgi:acyl-[acyl-carrier-protein]-phospholipid O-acyltransferase/long-chain-fatty-acid--[acyl-carrier-protein] ligase